MVVSCPWRRSLGYRFDVRCWVGGFLYSAEFDHILQVKIASMVFFGVSNKLGLAKIASDFSGLMISSTFTPLEFSMVSCLWAQESKDLGLL